MANEPHFAPAAVHSRWQVEKQMAMGLMALGLVAIATAASLEGKPSAPVDPEDPICDTGSLQGPVCTVTTLHNLDEVAAYKPIHFAGTLLIQGNGGIAGTRECDDPSVCTLSLIGGPQSSLIMKDRGSVLGPYVAVEAHTIALWNSSWINATEQPDYSTNTTCTLHVAATMSIRRKVGIALYNRSRITGSRINISTVGSLWVGSNAPTTAGTAATQFAQIDASGKSFTDAPSVPIAPTGAGGGYAGFGGNCGDPDGADGGMPYGPIFGSELACLDGSVGGSGSIGAQGGAGGGQILIKAFSLVLDGAITADGTAAPVASGGAQFGGGGGSGGCVHLHLNSSDTLDNEPPIHSSDPAVNGQWCGPGPGCTVSASGGNGHSGGSGGRIMMNATRASLLIQPITTNNMVAVGGIDLCTAQSGASKSVTQAGAAGTKFLNLKGDSAILAIDGAQGGLGAPTPVSGSHFRSGVKPEQISAIYGRSNANVRVDHAFAKRLHLKNFQLQGAQLSSRKGTSSDLLELKVQDISLIGASQLSASPVRISCSTLNLVDSTSQIVGRDQALVEINATRSMQIGGTIHSNAGVHLDCKGPHCNINVNQDGAVTVGTTGSGYLNLTAENVNIDGQLTGGVIPDSTAHYPITCTDRTTDSNLTANVWVRSSTLLVGPTGRIVGGSILVCPRHSSGEPGNRVRIAGRLYTKDSGPGQNSGIGKGIAPLTGGHAAGGAGHGGLGGRGVWHDPATNGTTNGGGIYDVNATPAHLPDHVGSGGGGSDGGGGTGGGIIAIRAKDLILETANPDPRKMAYLPNIDVRGGNAQTKTSGGGGSGGTVLISTKYLHGDGVIDARGGTGGWAPPADGKSKKILSLGGGGGGGVVWFDWQGGDAAAAAREFVSSGPNLRAGQVYLNGGKGGKHGAAQAPDLSSDDRSYLESAVANMWAPSPPIRPIYPVPIQHDGAAGDLTAPNCPAGYDGCLCKACPSGRFKANMTKHVGATCSSDGALPMLCDMCTNAPTRMKRGENGSDAFYTTRGQNNASCPYECRPGTILPRCLDPWDYTWDMGVLLFCAVLGPLVVVCLVRAGLEFALRVDGAAGVGARISATRSIDSNYSSLSVDGHLSFSNNRRNSNVGMSFAESMRDKLGWDGRSTQYNSPESGSMTAGTFTGSDDGKLKAADLPYLHSRLYLQGDNSPSQPWGLSKDPPATLIDLIDLDKYGDLVHLFSEMLQWTTQDKVIYGLLFIICHPLASSFHRKVRERNLAILSAYIVSAALPTLEGQPRINRLDDIFLQTERDAGRAAERVKLGHSSDATMAYLDIVIYNQRSLSSEERAKPRLPKMILFTGNGQWFSPFCLDTSDALVRSVVKMAPTTFASELNETVAQCRPDAVALDTSLVDVLSVLDRAHRSPESSVQFELRLLTVGGDRRLGLLARIKTWRDNSSQDLGQDMSEELRLQRHQGQVIVIDDLREMPIPARAQSVAVALLGLRNVSTKAETLLGSRIFFVLLLLCDLLFTLVVCVSAVKVPQDGYGIGESHYPILALFCAPGAAATILFAPLAGCIDLIFPELSITRQQTMWNLASMFSVTMLGVYIALDENLIIPKEKHSAFVWRHDYNYSLYACIALFVCKCCRNTAAVFVRAAWDQASLDRSEKTRAASGGGNAGDGPPVFLIDTRPPDVSPAGLADTQSTILLQQQHREFKEAQMKRARTGSTPSPVAARPSRGSNGGGGVSDSPRLESFGSLTGNLTPSVSPLNSSIPLAEANRRGRSESMREDGFGSMTSASGGSRLRQSEPAQRPESY